MEKWYHHNPVRSLVDMHIPNGEGYLGKFDPVRYAENVKRSGATVAYIYSTNCLGLRFYPTNIGMRHKEAERDIFGQTVAECRKRGLAVELRGKHRRSRRGRRCTRDGKRDSHDSVHAEEIHRKRRDKRDYEQAKDACNVRTLV